MKVEEAYLDVLQNIEVSIANEYVQNRSLKDHEALDAIQALVRQYAAEERGQIHIPGIYLASGARAVFDAARGMCEFRLGRSGDKSKVHLKGPAPISLNELLACLKRIGESIQHWTKLGGSRGYLEFITSALLVESAAGPLITDSVSDTTWKQLYRLAQSIYVLAPWRWMGEADVFGIEMPDIDETIFVSVMGQLGEYRCIAVYPSVNAVRSFWELANDEDASVPERIFEIPQIHMSFEGPSSLEPQDRRTLKRLNLKFKGEDCPLFRSYKPGFAPWFLEASEARMLQVALEQLLEVAPRVRADDALLWPEGEPDTCLVRVPRDQAGAQTWCDEFREIPPFKGDVRYIKLDSTHLRDFHRLPALRGAVELDCFLLHASIDGGGDRPQIPFVLMAADADTGIVMAHKLITVETTMSDMWAAMPHTLIETFVNLGGRPTCVIVRSGSLAVLADALSKVLGFELRMQSELRNIETARKSLNSYMQMPL
jgi:hypothetical protein